MTELETALAEIERLRGILLQCMPGANIVDLGNGQSICLNLKTGQPFREIKQEIENGTSVQT